MRIITVEFYGFKNYPANAKFNLQDEHENYIFDTQSDEKYRLFEIILGIVFGLTDEEKKIFQGDPSVTKIHTGIINLAYNQHTMIIERDFKTDFVACLLSDVNSVKPIYQGKDFVTGNYARPYLQMLQSIFPLIDKKMYREITYSLHKTAKSSFSEIMETLSLLLSPQFKISHFENLDISISDFIQSEASLLDAFKEHREGQDFLLTKREGLRYLLKAEKGTQTLKSARRKFMMLQKNIRQRKQMANSVENILNQRFPKLRSMNALQFRADVLLWKSLRDSKEKLQEKLRDTQNKQEQLQQEIEDNFQQYQNLPRLFFLTIDNFINRRKALKEQKIRYNELQGVIENLNQELERKKKNKWILLAVVIPIILITAFLLFDKNWLLIIPESIIAFLIVTFYSGLQLDKIKDKIQELTEESHIIQKRINDLAYNIEEIKNDFPMLREKRNIPYHISQFKLFRNKQLELKHLQKEENQLQAQLNSESYKEQLPKLHKKYGHLVDITRTDLEAFLDDFVSIKRQVEEAKTEESEHPETEFLNEISFKYEKLESRLEKKYQQLLQLLRVDGNSNDLKSAFEETQLKLKQQSNV
ncbi:MAG: hypothetical protein GF313_08600 [Caldithrix sp.]|nr:hypothetical protein [Caldithrix sp.]